jgi:hypothetical protein
MTEPLDPFESVLPEGLEKVLRSIEDDDLREKSRLLAQEFVRARSDAKALIEQDSFIDAWRGVMAIQDPLRLEAVLLIMIVNYRHARDPDGFAAWRDPK